MSSAAAKTDDTLLKAILDISSKFPQFERRAEEDRVRVNRLVEQLEIENSGSAINVNCPIKLVQSRRIMLLVTILVMVYLNASQNFKSKKKTLKHVPYFCLNKNSCTEKPGAAFTKHAEIKYCLRPQLLVATLGKFSV